MTILIAAVLEMLGFNSPSFDFDLELDGEDILAHLMEREQ